MAVVVLLACALSAPPASAHVQKSKQGLYVLGVDGWRQLAKQLVSVADNDAEQLNTLLDVMRDLVPPENDAERAALEQTKKTAADWARIQQRRGTVTVKKVQKDLNKWKRRVKPWFAKAADKRALENAVDAYMKGVTHLAHKSHGELLDAAGHLANEELDEASEHLVLGIGGAGFAEQEMTDAVKALSALT